MTALIVNVIKAKVMLTLYATAVKVALPCAGLWGTGHWTGMQVGSWERVQVPSA